MVFYIHSSKGNLFIKNLIRMKFILHKIIFRMGILSSSKTSYMSFNLHSKMTLFVFQLIIIVTVTIQVAILSRFSWNSHGWWGSIQMKPLVFGNNQPNRTTGTEENVPPKPVLWLSFSQYGLFWERKLQNHIWYPIFHRKGYIHFFLPMPHSLKIGHVP